MSPIPVEPTPSVVSETDTHVEAVKAAVSAVTQAAAYDVDEIGKAQNLPANYVEVYLSRRFSEESRRFDGFRTPIAWRLSLRVVSKSVSNARLMQDRIRTAFEGNTLDVETSVSTPVTFESESPIEPDGAWFTGLTDWTYVL